MTASLYVAGAVLTKKEFGTLVIGARIWVGLAVSEAEARGLMVASIQQKHPDYTIGMTTIQRIEDDTVFGYAKALERRDG